MVKRRTTGSLPEPSQLIDRAAEAASDAGDLGAELLSTGVDAATSLVGRLTSVPEERMNPPRRHAQKASGTTPVQRSGVTVKRAAEAAARENRKLAREEASVGKKLANTAKKTGRKVAKAAKRGRKK